MLPYLRLLLLPRPSCEGAAAQLTSPSGHKSAVQDWEDPGSGQFNVRSKDYLRNKKKELSEAAIYKCTPPPQMLPFRLAPVLLLALFLITGSRYQLVLLAYTRP